MKWTNKGHEFDELGSKIINLSAIYLFGAGHHGKTIYEKYKSKINIKGFIDNDKNKYSKNFCGLNVCSPAHFKLLANEAIIVTTGQSSFQEVTHQLSTLGHSNIFYADSFFPLLDAYKFGELCIPSLSFLPTTLCNLKCKHCLNFTPYIKTHQIRPVKQLISDLDLLFSKVDTLLLLHISGGEPFTHPHLSELIQHIGLRYKDKLGRLEMTTNGTIVPSAELLSVMYDAQVNLIVDDYRDALPHLSDKYNKVFELLYEYKISFRVQKAEKWINLSPFEFKQNELEKKNLCKHFNNCAVPWQEYRDRKLWLCNYASYAEIAGLQPTGIGEFFDLQMLTDENLLEAVEFRLGYSEKGYTEFCKRCAGYNNNPNIVNVAEQLV